MFSKNKKENPKPAAMAAPQTPVKPVPPSLLSVDLTITGNLKSKGEIQIDGTVHGDIATKKLLVGETADIKGEIVADSVLVHGKINGQIKAREVVLIKTAHVVGDILHENLSIEPGAFLEGLCKRITESELAETGKISVVNGGSKDSATDQPDPDVSAATASSPA